MNILIYLGHPAQYHFFKYIIRNLTDDGHKVKILIKTKDILEDLLREDKLEYVNIQEKVRKNSKLSILVASIKRCLLVIKEARNFKTDILIGTDSSIAQAGWILNKPALTTLEDDYAVIKNLARLTFPFSDSIVVPNVCDVGKRWQDKKIGYSGYMKLAYLHPNYFKPDIEICKKYGIQGKYVLIRLAKLSAHHDNGIGGLEEGNIQEVIRIAENKGYTVYISSEIPLNSSLERYRLSIRHTDIHNILAYAQLLISDSQSMSVEAAMLGTPSIRFSDFSGKISVLEELEHIYHLTYGIRTSNPEELIHRTETILGEDISSYKERHHKMLAEKIDVTAFVTWLIENYPKSKHILKHDTEYQYKFR